jgi:hypothetical protein
MSNNTLAPPRRPTSLDFFAQLKWIDGTPLLKTIEPYRRDIFRKALDEVGPDGRPRYNMVVSGRGKKNWKSGDLVLAALFCLLIPESSRGNDAVILGNDEGQAADDLSLAKKLVAANPDLLAELEVLMKEIRRRDGRGSLKILPAHDAVGSHGKTFGFIGYDEVHGFKTFDLLEALAPDPTRDCLVWVTSYDTIYNTPIVPLFDLKQAGFAGTDPRMLFSWYSGDRCTDPNFANLPPEQRANPSMASWPDGAGYLAQQKRRLPTSKYRRLHLNLPGSVSGAFFDQGVILRSVDTGITMRPWREGVRYFGAVDMSGGSSDDACLAIAHVEDGVAVLDLMIKQAGTVPFDPSAAVKRFADYIRFKYFLSEVHGDAYAGQTFFYEFQKYGISYRKVHRSTSDSYEAIEPRFNAGQIRLLDVSEMVDQYQTLIVRGAKIDHESGGHDDFACAATLALNAALEAEQHGTGILITSAPWPGNPEWGHGGNDRWRRNIVPEDELPPPKPQYA